MSYTDDFFKELNKKNKKNKKEENDTTKNKTKSNSGYANKFYSALNDDIAPLPSTATRYSELAPTELEHAGGEKDSWFKTGGFSDGVDGVGDFFGDLGETVAGTVGDLGLGMVKGVGRTVEGIVDLGTYAVGGVGGLLGFDDFKEKAKKVAQYNATDEWTKPATDFLDQYSVLGNKADMVSEGLGQVAAILLTAGVGSAAGLGSAGVTALTTGVTGLSSMGTGIGNAYNEDANDTEAFIYGLGSGAIEAGTELLSGGLGKAVKALGISRGIGGLDDIFAKKLSSTIVKSISNESVQKILGNTIEAGVKAGGEGLEEVLSGLGSAVMKWLTYEKDEDIKKLIEDEDLLEQFVVGAITSSIAQGADYVKANKSGRDFVTGYTNNEQAVIDKEVEKRVSEKEKNGSKLTNKEIVAIEEQVRNDMEHGQLNIETIEEVLGGEKYTAYKDTVKNEEALKAEYDRLADIKKSDLTTKQEKRLAELEAMNLEDTTKRNSLRKELNDTVFPQLNDSKLAESYKEIERQDQKFEVDLTKYKGKQREAVERAVKSGVLNNTYRSHVLVDTLSRIEADKGITFDYTNNKKLKESGFAVEGVRVNGYANKSTGTVTLNVQSKKAWQSVVGHEITHILKGTKHYTALKDALFAYAESKGELANRRTTLTELYQNLDADVDEELTADLVGDYLFTDKAFIDKLTGNRPLFQKIYDEIKYLCKVATGKELTDIEKVKHEFDMAWKEISAKGVKETGGKNQYSLTADDLKVEAARFVSENADDYGDSWGFRADNYDYEIGETMHKSHELYQDAMYDDDGELLYPEGEGVYSGFYDAGELDGTSTVGFDAYSRDLETTIAKALKSTKRYAYDDKKYLYIVSGDNGYGGSDIGESIISGATVRKKFRINEDGTYDEITSEPDIRYSPSKDGGKVQYSVSAESDADYMTAVERGNMETAQKMVDEAAKKAGYNSPVLYHGSPSFGFTQIDTKKSNDHISFFATDSMQTAGTYSGTSTVRNIGDTSESSLGMYQFYANTDGMVEFDAKGAESNHIALGQAEKDYNDFVYGGSWYSFATAKQLAKYAKQKGYTGVIIKNVVDAANPQSRKTLSPANVYIFFSPQSQLKSADPVTYDDNGNVIPLSQRFNADNNDIRFSLSKEGEQYAPVGDYSTPFNELAYDEDIAPVETATSAKEAAKPVTNTDEGYPDNIVPMTEEEANSLAKDYLNSLTEEDAPPEMPEPYYGEEDAPVDLFEDRDIIAVGRRSVKAYMYENPEVKPFFQAEANIMLGDLARTTRGERVVDAQVLYDTNGENGVYGLKRNTSPEIAYLKDEFGYTYDEIKAGLKAIIEDDGAENNACSKRIEFMLNDRLMNGYRDFVDGIEIPANQEYIRLVREKGINEYNEEARKHFFENADSYAPPAEEDIAPVTGDETAPAVDEIQPMTEDESNAIQEEKAKADKAAEGTPKSRRQLYRRIIERIKSTFKSAGFDFDEALKNAKNLSTFATVDNTPQRVMEKALGYKEGQTLADLTVNKVAQNETAGIKWLNSYTDRKNGLLRQISDQYHIKPGSKESAAAQMYAEGFYVNDNNEIVAYGDAELAQDFPNLGVQYRIKGLAHDPRIRQIYDETLDAINASRTRNAYPEIQKLDNYFLHFRAMDDTFSRLGLPFNPNDIRAKDLPTDLNGVTADLKPGQPYFASAMHRKGKRTSFDLLGGLERYLTSAKNQIYHIDDIQTLRALRNYIADTYGQANGLEGIDTLSEEEAQERIEAVYNSHLSTFAKFLNEEANILAGKTALIDRGLEGVIGRRGMTFLSTVQKQTGSNMVGFNISSSLTNFLPVAQTLAKTNKFDFVKAFAQTVSNKIGSVFGKNDGFAENSPVMIRRKGAARFYRTPYQIAADAGYVLLSAVDDISTELIARTKFNELTRKGMDEQTAHFETDKWVSRLMGDRSLGQQPQLYNSKTLGFLTQFQLEVRNQLDSQFYDTIQEAKVSNEDIENALVRNAKTAAKVTSTFLQLAVVQHLFGKAFESVAGYNPAFDIISVLATMFGFDDEEDSEDTALDNIEQGFFDLLEDLPYTSTFTGGRIPIASALPIKELIKGEDSYGNEKSRLETLKETAPYYVLPGGYGQLKKTYQGLNMFSDEHPVSGSYTDSGKLRFPVEDTTANRVQAAIFGQYASENAREYFDNDYAPMDPGKYAVAKAVGGYSAYKTYSSELYDIKSDKDENGKSISGSRKEKVIDYINNLDADYYTKIILFKSEYPSDDTYNADIVNYVINSDFTYDEKASILTELGFRVTADGEIYAD